MCIMGNGNDLPVCLPSWKFPNENHQTVALTVTH